MRSRKVAFGILIVIGVLLLAVAGVVFGQAFLRSTIAEPLLSVVNDGQQQVPLSGQYLQGCRIFVHTTSSSIPEGAMLPLTPVAGNALADQLAAQDIPATSAAVLGMLSHVETVTVDIGAIWDKLRDGDRLHFTLVQQSPFARLLPALFTYQCRTEVAVSGAFLPSLVPDNPAAENFPFPHLYKIFKPTFTTGEIVRLPGEDFGKQKGELSIDGKVAPTIYWTPTEIIFRVPEETKPGENVVFKITRHDDRKDVKFLISVVAPAPLTPPVPDPALDKTSLKPVEIGQTVRVSGEHFGTPGSVVSNKKRAEVSFWSEKAVAFTVPAGVPTGLQQFTITRQDGKSVSFSVQVAAPKPEVAPVAKEDPVSLLLQGYRKSKEGDMPRARALFEKAGEVAGDRTAEGLAVRASARYLLDAADQEAGALADRALAEAKNGREEALARLALGWKTDMKDHWKAAAGAGDDNIKVLAEELLDDRFGKGQW